ncbi:MAG: chalcone isomerase family protein [Methylophaga sp.]|nr:chalcone isomerase family protein [Methylophaga sp.]
MLKTLIFSSMILLTGISHAGSFTDRSAFSGQILQLCSESALRVMLFNLGDVALYRQQCSAAPDPLSPPLKLSFVYNRGFTGDEFRKSADELIRRNVDDATYQQIEADLQVFNAGYQDVRAGDRYDIGFSENAGLVLLKNGTQVSQSDSLELAAVYYKIWFGNNPFSGRVKSNLLNGLE